MPSPIDRPSKQSRSSPSMPDADDGGRAAIGSVNAQRSDARTGQCHRGFDESVQSAIQIEIGTDVDDDLD